MIVVLGRKHALMMASNVSAISKRFKTSVSSFYLTSTKTHAVARNLPQLHFCDEAAPAYFQNAATPHPGNYH
jgi:hypothetical protein